jgi:MFS family permease
VPKIDCRFPAAPRKLDGMTARRTPRLLRPLRHRNYRLLFASLLCSLITEGMWTVALVWQVIGMGGSASALSTVSAAAGLGLVVSTLGGGVLADRLPQQRILLVLESVKALALGTVGAVVLAGFAGTTMLTGAAFLIGLVGGCYYPAYAALVPRLVPAEELLAVNGYEGMVRPAATMAFGPAAAAWIIAVSSPGFALLATAATALLAAIAVAPVRVPSRSGGTEMDGAGASGSGGGEAPGHPLRELAEGVGYAVRTPWLLAVLLFASLMVLVVTGPIDVLIPFAIKQSAHGSAGDHSVVLAAYGFGGVAGAALIAGRPLPRRYLTMMMVCWGGGTLPLLVFGYTTHVAVMALAGFVIGVMFEAPSVVWGTLLQRRVPRRLLGRVSSLDFFVSLVFLPVSMALSGPLAQWVGLRPAFAVAALVPVPVAVIAWFAAGMRRDELRNPLSSFTDGSSASDPSTSDTVVSPNVNLSAPDGPVR